jgi:Uma2 family endonuclease
VATIVDRLITAEEFEQMPAGAGKRELVNGEVVEQVPPNLEHGFIATFIALMLVTWSQQGRHGYVGVESGFIVSRTPDNVRSPDVFFISAEHLKAVSSLKGFSQQPPDLAVEVISPSESAEEIHGKVRDYLAAGTAMVWTIFPDRREVVAHTPDGIARTFGPDATLEFPEMLPGFSCAVAAIFASLPLV